MPIQRRELLSGAGALLVAGIAKSAVAAEHEHAGGSHEKPSALFDAALVCSATGELCMAHCFEVLATGDASIAACAESVHEMMAVTEAIERLAAMRSTRVAAIARASKAVYENCETLCNKHGAKHEACKKCALACRAMIDAIEDLPA